MSDRETPPKPHRRRASAVLTGLATGAMLSAAAAAPAAVLTAGSAAPVQQQFDAAFTPGAVAINDGGGAPIIVDVG